MVLALLRGGFSLGELSFRPIRRKSPDSSQLAHLGSLVIVHAPTPAQAHATVARLHSAGGLPVADSAGATVVLARSAWIGQP